MPVGPTDLVAGEHQEVAVVGIADVDPAAAARPARRRSPTRAPQPCARAARSATGLIVPSMLETQVNATTLVFSSTRWSIVAQVQLAVVGQAEPAQLAPERSHASCHGTMLEWCSISVITTLSPGASSIVRRGRQQVQRLGGVLGEDRPRCATGALMNAGDLVARLLERHRRLRAELVHRARDVGVVPLEVVDHRVDHHLRLLRGVGAVEVDQRHPAREGALEDREVLADDLELGEQTGQLGHDQTAAALTYLS